MNAPPHNRLAVSLLLAFAGIVFPAAAQTTVRMGIYQNSPKVGLSESGEPEGIFVDLIEAVAAEERWTIEYVPGTWAEGIDRLAAGEIDLMPDVAFSDEREKRFAFHREPVLSDWFEIYARRDGGIRALLDLKGRRVAVLEDSVQQDVFGKMVADFDLGALLVPYPDFARAFAAVANGAADAVIANRFHGSAYLRGGKIEDTGIIFHPTRVFFAAPPTGEPALRDAIDFRLRQMKSNPASAYYQSLERWTSEDVGFRWPAWLKSAGIAVAALLLFSFAWSTSLKRQVSARTRQLKARNQEIERLYQAVRESEERFRSFVENANDIVFTLSLDGVLNYISPNWKDILGHEARDVVGRHFQDFVHPDDLPACRAAMDRARDGQKQSGIEFRVRHRDGSWRWHFTNGSALHGPGNDFYLGISRDITERKRAEKRLRLHAQLLDSVRESVVASDLEGRILYWGLGAEKLYGYAAEEAMGKSYWDLAGAVAPPDQQAFRRELLEKGSWSGEHVQKNRRGETFWASTFVSLVLDEQEKPAGFIGIDQNVDQRRRAEEDLRRSNAFLDSIVENIPVMLFLKDARDLRFVRINRTGEELLGLPRTELLGKTDYDFFPKEQADSFTRIDREVLQGKKAVDIPEEPLQSPGGGERILHTRKVPILNAAGEPEYLLGISEDVTDRRRAETEREQLESRLAQSQKMESVGHLAGGIAHDFNNMLGAILGYAELMLENLDPQHPHYADLHEIRKAAERSADLTRQLLAFARQQPAAPRPIDLNATVLDMLHMLRRLIGEDVRLSWTPGKDLWPVWMDPSQIDQVLATLCVNARDAIAGEGRISIETANVHLDAADGSLQPDRAPGDYVRLAVGDSGIAMDKETMGKLFEPFFTTMGLGRGSGLGLATVYGIVEQNNGFIDVESLPGQGNVFRIFLPRLAQEPS